MEKAGFGARLIAYIVDMLALSVIGWVISIAAAPLISVGSGSDGGIMGMMAGVLSWVLFAVLFLLQFLYFGYMWSKNGQSVGMKVMNIKVVKRDEGPFTFLMAGLRGSVGYWISAVVFFLGFIWAAFDANGEGWHDKIFGTRVVQA